MSDTHGSPPVSGERDLYDGRELADLVLYDTPRPHIARITLNRPERRNALLTPDMLDLIGEHYAQAEDDDAIKVVIVTAAGDNFCAGEDMRRLPVEGMGMTKGKKLGQSVRMRGAKKLHDGLDRRFLMGDKTTILACRGAVVGAGMHMALGVDFIVASETAFFGRPQARIGFAGYNNVLPLWLSRFGVNRGYELLMTGRTATAAEMKDWGIAASVVPDEDLEDEAFRFAEALSLHSTDGLMLGRLAMQMYWNLQGMGQWSSFMNIGHPMFTNTVWRDDEYNFLKERSRVGHMEAMQELKDRWAEHGFE